MKVLIGVGSNLGDRHTYLRRAEALLQNHPQIRVAQKSSVFETEPVGGPPQRRFLNAVWRLETSLSARDLLGVLQAIERQLGRERKIPKGPRTIDLDILFYEDRIFDEPELQIPHPRLHERAFVLEPLCEIEPNSVHPVMGKSVKALWENLRNVQNRRDCASVS